MQTIHRTDHTENFTLFSNEYISAPLPLAAKAVLNHLLTKPLNWRMQRNELKKTLNLSGYKVQQALKWLQLNCYAYFTRFCGRTTWHFTDQPHSIPAQQTASTANSPAAQQPTQATAIETAETRVNTESIEIQHVENRHVLQITETDTNTETTTTPLNNTVTESTVVVVESELIYPVQLPADKHGAAKHKLKKLKQPELQQPVLFALAYAMTQGTVKNPIAYLAGIVTAANNGGFTPVDTAGATKASKPLIPIWQGHKTPPKVDNDSFFAELINRYGSKAAMEIPESVKHVVIYADSDPSFTGQEAAYKLVRKLKS